MLNRIVYSIQGIVYSIQDKELTALGPPFFKAHYGGKMKRYVDFGSSIIILISKEIPYGAENRPWRTKSAFR